MQRNRPPSPQTVNVLRALAAEPARWRYGYDLGTEVHLKSGSLYPILSGWPTVACWRRPGSRASVAARPDTYTG